MENNPLARQHFHIIGIGGAGMSAIATVLVRMGKTVSGSDLKESHVTERLRSQGINVAVPHKRDNLTDGVDCVVRSSAISDENDEVVAARIRGIEVFSRSDMLSAICAQEKSIGVAGSHGKTTTTSMVTAIARAADLSPSFMIGGDVNEIGTNAAYNKDSYLIVEADESDKTFLTLSLVAGIVTNIEADHLENYNGSFDELRESFYHFAQNISGPVVVCVDEDNAHRLTEHLLQTRDVITVGANNASYTYEITSHSRGGISARVHNANGDFDLELAVPGTHNIRNALCALAVMHELGVSIEDCCQGLSTFGGVARRFQFRGETKGITFVDDYAHLPTEIEVTLQAAHNGGFSRVVAIFQPHRYSRTQALYKEFAQSLISADLVAVCDIYPAGETPRPGVSGTLITDELLSLGHEHTYGVRHIDDVVAFVADHARSGDIVLTLGAGDVTMYSDVIQDTLVGETVASLPVEKT